MQINRSRGSSKTFLFLAGIALMIPLDPLPCQASTGFEVARGTLLDTAITNQWTSFSFLTSFTSTPLVFAVPTEQGGDPCAIRITNITTAGFQASCLEPATEDGTHTSMDFHYLAIEPGLYQLPLAGGSSLLVEAGFIDTTTVQHRCLAGCGPTGWDSITFNPQLTASLSTAPAVLTQIQGLANETNTGAAPSSPFLSTAVATGSTTTSGFQVALERSESASGSVTQDERIGWIALPAGPTCRTLDLGGGATVLFEAAISPTIFDGWDDGCDESVAFQCTFGAAPIVVGSRSTRLGNNGGWARRCSLSATDVFFTIDEDQDRDGERNHIEEVVSLVAFAAPVATTLVSYTLITDFSLQELDGGLAATWSTSGETGAASYYLLARGRDGQLETLHPEPIPALLSAPQGATYRVDLRNAAWPPGQQLWIREIEIDGEQQLHGPLVPRRTFDDLRDDGTASAWSPGQSSARPKPAEPLVELSELDPITSISGTRSPSRVALEVRSTGPYGLSWQRLSEAFELPESKIRELADRGLLELTRDGQPVAWGTDSSSRRLLFFGVENEDPLRAETVYHLRHSFPGARIETDQVVPGRADPEPSFEARSRFEDNAFPVTALPLDPDSDLWMWHGFHSGLPDHAVGHFAFDLEAPVGRSAATGRVSIVLQGASSRPEQVAHRVGIEVNGHFLGEQRFFDLERATLDYSFPAAWLQEAGNELRIEALGPLPAGEPSLFFLDRFEIAYQRELISGHDPFVFRPTVGEGIEAGGFPTRPSAGSELLLFSLEDPNRPRRLTGFAELEREGRRFVNFRALAEVDHLLTTEGAILEPQELRPVRPASLRDHRGAEHLVVSPSAWASGAEVLSHRRRTEGLRSAVISVQDIYDEFSFGHRDPRALQSFLRYAYLHWPIPPRYVVLLGDGHLDYRGHGGARPNLIPPRLVATSEGLYASDNTFADFDADGVPELAVGRVPATTLAELLVWMEKLEVWEESSTTSWRSSALLLADVPDSGGNFDGAARKLAQSLAAVGSSYGWRSEVLSIGEVGFGEARETLLERLNGNVGLVTWVGHGGLDRWSRDGLLTQGDVESITGDQRSAVVLVLGCNTNRFELPGFTSLGGDLTLHPEGGAVAVLAPSGATRLSQTFDLGTRWLEALANPSSRGRLGDRLLSAIQHASSDPRAALSAETLQVYVLFGDPATRTW